MCELFAFSGEHPALLHYSLQEFARHSGATHNAEGWGIAHYLDGDVRLLKETGAARDSACLSFIEQHPVRSALVLSHIRHATQGVAAVRNCQPFVRELGGAMHVFAHNGDLDRLALSRLATQDGFRPVGETDSELAFCVLLERLRPLWRNAAAAPPLEARRRIVAAFAQALRALGPANFIYADGDALFAHGHRRTQDGGAIRPPGLHLLCRSCSPDNSELSGLEAQGLRIEPTQAGGAQVLVASVPLSQRRAAPELTHPLGGRTPPGVAGALATDASWRALGEGELVVVRAGHF